jgi:uridine phosphorylase
MPVPNVPGKADFRSVYAAVDFLAGLRAKGWDPGLVPDAVVFTYGGFDLLCAAQPALYTMNPMLGPGPGRFFAVDATDGRVGICCLGIGAPAAVAQLEVLVALGVHRFLSLGTAGGLGPDQRIGDVVVLTEAVRDEGVSYHYAANGVAARPDPSLTASLADALTGAGIAHSSGGTWTIDAPYRQTAEEIVECRQRGLLTVEMEAAALFVVTAARDVSLASAVVLDSVYGEPVGAPRIDTSAAFGALHRVVLAGVDALG